MPQPIRDYCLFSNMANCISQEQLSVVLCNLGGTFFFSHLSAVNFHFHTDFFDLDTIQSIFLLNTFLSLHRVSYSLVSEAQNIAYSMFAIFSRREAGAIFILKQKSFQRHQSHTLWRATRVEAIPFQRNKENHLKTIYENKYI